MFVSVEPSKFQLYVLYVVGWKWPMCVRFEFANCKPPKCIQFEFVVQVQLMYQLLYEMTIDLSFVSVISCKVKFEFNCNQCV